MSEVHHSICDTCHGRTWFKMSVCLGKPEQKYGHTSCSMTSTAEVGSVHRSSAMHLQRIYTKWKKNRSNVLQMCRSACTCNGQLPRISGSHVAHSKLLLQQKGCLALRNPGQTYRIKQDQ